VEPIATKDELVLALRDAAEIEQQLMCEYLYAALSLKSGPDERCTPSQFEFVRRWCSTILLVARQEMEHLSLVNSMLTAVGAPPYFLRENIGKGGLLSPYFTGSTLAAKSELDGPQPIELPYTLERFDRATIERFVCGESPPYGDLPAGLHPDWCFTPDSAAREAGSAVGNADGTPRSPLGSSHLAQNREQIGAGTVQELYAAIGLAFERIPGLFVDNPPQVPVPVEYNVFVFPVTDTQSALAAVNLIVRQGEGLQGPWTYESHFRRFFEMREELVSLQASDPQFDPGLPLLDNPVLDDIEEPFTRRVFEVVNHSYVTLLLMLTSLYGRAQPEDNYPYLSTALAQMTFAPTMTTIVRAMAEVLVRLPIGSGTDRTGPNFFIGRSDRALLADPQAECFGEIEFFLDRWEHLTAELDDLAGAWVAPTIAPGDGAEARVGEDLRYLHQNAFRVTANLRRIYQAGYYSKFVSI
jgi:hypothetical protein